jgi:hypothetical protein
MAQLFLSCSAVNPDETETKVDADEFEHTAIEQQARRDQQRVLMALARRNQQPGNGRRDGTHRRRALRSPRTGGVRIAGTAHGGWRRWTSVLQRAL